jgi:hypothetical protein
VEHHADRIQHMLHPLGDVDRRETHDSKPSRLEPSRAGGVAGRRPIEHLAPDLDHQARRQACEINDVRPDQRLPPELETVEPLIAQARPQIPLDAAHRSAEISGELDSG